MQLIISRTVIITIIWQVDYVSVHRTLRMTMWGSLLTKDRGSNQRTFCLFTWTHLAALSIYFLRVLAGVSIGAVNFLTLLFGDITSTQHTLHNAKCPEVRVPGFTMRIGLSIGNTYWKRTQYWKLKARELKWAPVLRTQTLNPLRHQASLVLYMAMEIHLQDSLFQINTVWVLFYHQQLYGFFSSSLWMLISVWLSISKCFFLSAGMNESKVLSILGI